MGFSVKVLPGVRLSATRRGVRTSLGPRIARVHVGGGSTGLSSGLGPFTVWGSAGIPKSRSSRRVGNSWAQLDSYSLSSPTQTKAGVAMKIQIEIDSLTNKHKQQFAEATPPIANLEQSPPDRNLIYLRLYKDLVKGIGIFKFKERKRIKGKALQLAEVEVQKTLLQQSQEIDLEQRRLDMLWEKLLNNDKEVLMDTLTSAFADNEVATIPIGLEGDSVNIVVMIPSESIVPDRLPGVTPSGNVSIKKMPISTKREIYKNLVCGHVAATIRETLAVCPRLDSVKIVALRLDREDVFGKSVFSCILAGDWSRGTMQRVQWDRVDAYSAVAESADTFLINLSRGEMKNISLDDTDIDELISLIDYKE